jgi:Domain of unknown function (DUF4440)
MVKLYFVCLLFCAVAFGQQTHNEKAVWQKEEAYWQFLHDGQKTAYLALWDEHFVGWPRFEANPSGKDKILTTFFAPVSEYKLMPLSVREYGKDIVVTFYRASITRNGVTRTSRLSHTWMRSKSGWRTLPRRAAARAPKANKYRLVGSRILINAIPHSACHESSTVLLSD